MDLDGAFLVVYTWGLTAARRPHRQNLRDSRCIQLCFHKLWRKTEQVESRSLVVTNFRGSKSFIRVSLLTAILLPMG